MRAWIVRRMKEITTWLGLAIIAVAQLQLQSGANHTVDMVLQQFNQYGPTIGGALVAFSGRHT